MATAVYELLDYVGLMFKDNLLETICLLVYVVMVVSGNGSPLMVLITKAYKQVVCCIPFHQWIGPLVIALFPPVVSTPLFVATIIKLLRQWYVRPTVSRFGVFFVLGLVIWFLYFSSISIIGPGLHWRGILCAFSLYSIVCCMNDGRTVIGFRVLLASFVIGVTTVTSDDLKAELSLKTFGHENWDTSVNLATLMGCNASDCVGSSRSKVLDPSHPYNTKCASNLIDCVSMWQMVNLPTEQPVTVRPGGGKRKKRDMPSVMSMETEKKIVGSTILDVASVPEIREQV